MRCLFSKLAWMWNRFLLLRFLFVGGWNFIFGYCCFAALYWGLDGKFPDFVILLASSVLGITNSFITHRWVTYCSRGPVWREYFRFYMVYGVQVVLNLSLFWLFVTVWSFNAYYCQFVLNTVLTIASYFGHQKFSFAAETKNKL